ncbi:MAG: DUF1552 domain-containing protein [Fuerstiella sp.]|nr:DUF1552 domain-containing protein [Fuerstiella sp.]
MPHHCNSVTNPGPHIARPAMSRRHVLKATGTCIALPFLDGMVPSGTARASASSADVPRFVAINAGLGFHAPFLFPEAEGSDHELTPYLEQIKAHRRNFTLFSGLSHPNQNGNNGHASSMTWLTSAPRPGLAGFKNTISLDQLMARQLAGRTRVPYLTLSARSSSLSWSANGVQIPAQSSPARLFKQLFVQGTQDEIAAEIRELHRGKSILDTVLRDANRLNQSLGPRDREKLDEYFSSVRDLETRIQQNEDWIHRPRPSVDRESPTDIADGNDILARQRLMYDMIALALQTDSTRVVTFNLGSLNAVPSNIEGVNTDWHNLSHHGKDEAKIEELQRIETEEFRAFNAFLNRLTSIKEADKSLLDHTAVLFGSNLGNASSHDWHNLPIIIAGGGYKHCSYVAHDKKNNTPLANVFVSLAQRMGVETGRFGSSTGESVRGLER